jgi:molybdenum cofactor cytidylyltransferase
VKPVGVILAAGLSSRMGKPKALLPFGKTTFLGSFADAFTATLDRTIVVLGCDADAIQPTLEGRPGLQSIINANYQLGMLSSLQAGLAVAPADAPIAFTLVDHPGLKPESLERLCEASAANAAPVVIPRYLGERGHPVLISAEVAAELRALPPDRSPKEVIRAHRPATVFVDLEDPAVTLDIDRPEDLARLPAAADPLR